MMSVGWELVWTTLSLVTRTNMGSWQLVWPTGIGACNGEPSWLVGWLFV